MVGHSKNAYLFLALIAVTLIVIGSTNSAKAQYGSNSSNRQWSFNDRITRSQIIETHLNDRGSELKPPPSKLFKQIDQYNGQSYNLSPSLNRSADEGYFTVPNWFGAQPKAFERPVETFRSSSELSVPFSSFGFTPWSFVRTPLPFGYTPWLGGYSSIFGYAPRYSSWNNFGAWAYPGYHRLGNWGGYNAWGYPPAYASPFHSFGSSNFRPGSITSSRVSQNAPSKPAGNYYTPANVDSSASGSYYASGTPYLMPIMAPKQAPQNYWGSSGNPFPQDLNTTPWSK